MLYNTPAIFIINLISGYVADQSYISYGLENG